MSDLTPHEAAAEVVSHVRALVEAIATKPLNGIDARDALAAATQLIGANLIADAIQAVFAAVEPAGEETFAELLETLDDDGEDLE